MVRSLYCPDCRDERTFEQPPCEDGHDDCLDWSCVECGAGVIVGVALIADAGSLAAVAVEVRQHLHAA